MSEAAAAAFERQIQRAWGRSNAAGVITYRSETLRTRRLQVRDLTLDLVRNASRDQYDRATRAGNRPQPSSTEACPLCGESNPELGRTDDGYFRVLGNRFACIRYQCLLTPTEHRTELDEPTIARAMAFARRHPNLTLLLNGPNAGRTVAHLAWLLSFKPYDQLRYHRAEATEVCEYGDTPIRRRLRPAYALDWRIPARESEAVEPLSSLLSSVGHRDYNVFLESGHCTFVPRMPIETPTLFPGHRFGGLEMIGYFVVKDDHQFEQADPHRLLRGIEEIGLSQPRRETLERDLVDRAARRAVR